MKTKICPGTGIYTNYKCLVTNEPQPIDNFGNSNVTKDGKRTACKKCRIPENAAAHVRYSANGQRKKYNDGTNGIRKIPASQGGKKEELTAWRNTHYSKSDVQTEMRFRGNASSNLKKANIDKAKYFDGSSKNMIRLSRQQLDHVLRTRQIQYGYDKIEEVALDHAVPISLIRKKFKDSDEKILVKALICNNSPINLQFISRELNGFKSAKLLDCYKPLYNLMIRCATSTMSISSFEKEAKLLEIENIEWYKESLISLEQEMNKNKSTKKGK